MTAGLAEYIEPLASAGVAAGVDGVFLEVHEDPSRAKSDAQNALRLDALDAAARAAHPLAIDAIVNASGERHDVAGHAPTPSRTSTWRASVLRIEADAILGARRPLDASFRRRVGPAARAAAGRVILTGMGKSGIICRKIAATLSSTGTPAFFLHPAEAIHGDLGVLQADDVVVALSLQRRNRGAAPAARDDPPRRREADRHDRARPPRRSARPPT